jgi:hypothetical protein
VLQLKQEPDTNWQKSYTALASSLVNFIFANKDEVTEWQGKGNAAEFFAA